jgi:polyhydroxyalkanoate synthesis repressor PhaR
MGTIRRYGSRKLYDPGASRYVSLGELAARIRGGEEVEVLDNASGENVTAPTLMQNLVEEGRSGRGRLPSEVLHDLLRVSGEKSTGGVGQAQATVSRLMLASLGRLVPVRETRRDITRLDERLRHLEATLAQLGRKPPAQPGRKPPAQPGRKRPAALARRPPAPRKK